MGSAGRFLGFAFVVSVFSSAALADLPRSWPRQYGHEDMHGFLANREHPHGKHTQESQPLQCGDEIRVNTVPKQDLICPSTTGFALQVVGDHITLDGNGHRIVAPLAAAGVYVQGHSDTVTGVQVNGAKTYGIFAYDSPGIAIIGNDVSKNSIGIEIYAETTHLTGAVVQGNIAQSNLVFGMRTAQDGVGTVDSPLIQWNDFSASGSYAIVADASRLELDATDFNLMLGSSNGLYLGRGTFSIHDLALSFQLIQNTGIFADSATSLTLENIDVSTLLSPQLSETHTAIDLYRVDQFQLSNVLADHNDIGIRLETEQHVSPTGSIQHCSFGFNIFAGISIISYDGTAYGPITLSDNHFEESSTAKDVVVDPHTVVP